jgi:hypothetical protein
MVEVFDTARLRFAPLIAGTADTGTQQPPQLDAGIGTGEPSGTGIEDDPGTGMEDTADTGTVAGTEPPAKTGRTSRQKAGTRTGTKKPAKTDWSVLVARARELNEACLRDHGKPISGDKLATELRVSKRKALDVLAEAKRPRAVPADGVA